MSIKDFTEKIKPFYFLILFAIIASIFFALGRLSAIEERHSPVKILEPADGQQANVISAISDGAGVSNSTMSAGTDSNPATSATVSPSATSGEVIGSKTGKKYYFPWCSTVKRIKPENQVTFASIALAKSAGYTAGGNCKGLQ
jgi:hypothetical protein